MPGLKIPVIIPCVECGAQLKRFRWIPNPICPRCKSIRSTIHNRESYFGSERQRRKMALWREANPLRSAIDFCLDCSATVGATRKQDLPKRCQRCRDIRRHTLQAAGRPATRKRQKERMAVDAEYRAQVEALRAKHRRLDKIRREEDPELQRRATASRGRREKEQAERDPVYKQKRHDRRYKRRTKGTVPIDIRQMLMVLQRGRCANPFCRVRLVDENIHLDHIVAIVRGGTNEASNLQLLCGSCNDRKWAHSYGDFLESERLKRERSTA